MVPEVFKVYQNRSKDPVHKKLNGQKKIRITFVSEKKNW
jgi:hypothetical protein